MTESTKLADLGSNAGLGVIPYKSAEWIWVSNHYDLHLAGLLRYGGKLCRFETDYDSGEVSVYRLTTAAKLKWLTRKKLFEWCVGYHWSYPERKRGEYFRWRKPEWLHRLVFRAYYWWRK